MNKSDLTETLRLHALWLSGDPDGQRADLRGCALRGCALRGADLRGVDLRGCDLSTADLSNVDLNGADLRGCDLDYSCWPLWCGSQDVTVDRRIAAQLAAHFCVLVCDDPEYLAAREALLPFARTSHRADDLGLLAESVGCGAHTDEGRFG